MAREETLVLIPSHSLEDFPTEVSEEDAASLLNCFAVAWHPLLLATTGRLPKWHRADCPPEEDPGRSIAIVPTNCESWLATGWADRVTAGGGLVIRGLSERSALVSEIEQRLGEGRTVDPELAADFYALGHAWLQIELLTRKMRHFSNIDEVYLQREAVAAAEAALAGDRETMSARLTQCFETLLEQRQRFYAVECWLLDLCLVTAAEDLGPLEESLRDPRGVSLLCDATDLVDAATRSPLVKARLKEGVARGEVEVVCGAVKDTALVQRSVNSILWQLRTTREMVAGVTGKPPFVWGVRRYSVDPVLPQLLKRTGYEGALHFVLDDGVYPDYEHSKFRWEGLDGTPIDSISRIPLSAESATSYLKFPDRMSESMDNDQSAAVVLARWPGSKSPFFEDFKRMDRYAPVLGKMVTFREFFDRTDFATRSGNYKPREYLAPFFWQAVARETADPLSSLRSHRHLRAALDSGAWCAALAATIRSQPVAAYEPELERELEDVGEFRTPADAAALAQRIEVAQRMAAKDLGELISRNGGSERGYLVLNPVAIERVVALELDGPPPVIDGDLVQSTGTKHLTVLRLPSAGYVWIPARPAGSPVPTQKPVKATKAVPLAEENLLRNDFFEVCLHPDRGGIASVKTYGRCPNLVSQQLNFRYPAERIWTVGEGDEAREIRSQYAEVRATSSEILSRGPVCGSIRTKGEIVDQQTQRVLARFEQTFRVWRKRPVIEIEIQFDTVKRAEAEAWHSYFASRFAWQGGGVLCRSAHGAPFEVSEERLESPEYLEIAANEHRVTILPGGLPYQRVHEPGQVDVILSAGAESARQHRLVIAIDQQHPDRAARDAATPAIVLNDVSGPPRVGAAGWLLHSSSKAVEVVSLGPLVSEPETPVAAWHSTDTASAREPATVPPGLTVRLMETEGRVAYTDLSLFKPPTKARQRDFLGNTSLALTVVDGKVPVRLGAFEVLDVELYWDA